jgi:hypothetical protein
MGVEEVDAVIKDIIKEMGVTNPSDMCKVIGAANKKLAGMAEGKVIADSVKKILSNL